MVFQYQQKLVKGPQFTAALSCKIVYDICLLGGTRALQPELALDEIFYFFPFLSRFLQVPPSLSTWQPHPSNIGLKITQSFANASWPWTSSKSAGSGVAGGGSSFSNHGSSDEPKQSLIPALSPPAAAPSLEISGEIGDGSRGSEGISVSVDDSEGTFLSAVVGVSGGSGGGGVRARLGMKDVVPSLRLDDDDVGVVDHGTVNEGDAYDSSAADDMYGGQAGAGVHVKGGVNGSTAADDEKRNEGDGAEEIGKEMSEKEGSGNVREGTVAGGVSGVNGAFRCHACGGTVEGPKHSTCTCEACICDDVLI